MHLASGWDWVSPNPAQHCSEWKRFRKEAWDSAVKQEAPTHGHVIVQRIWVSCHFKFLLIIWTKERGACYLICGTSSQELWQQGLEVQHDLLNWREGLKPMRWNLIKDKCSTLHFKRSYIPNATLAGWNERPCEHVSYDFFYEWKITEQYFRKASGGCRGTQTKCELSVWFCCKNQRSGQRCTNSIVVCLPASVPEEAKQKETVFPEEECNVLPGKFVLLSPLNTKFPSSQDQTMMGFLRLTEIGLSKLRMSSHLSNPVK